jgi:alanine dehydrogenase
MERRQFLAASIATSAVAAASGAAAEAQPGGLREFYVLRLANLGAREAIRQDAGLAEGLNTWMGTLTHRGVAESQQRPWTAAASVIG